MDYLSFLWLLKFYFRKTKKTDINPNNKLNINTATAHVG